MTLLLLTLSTEVQAVPVIDTSGLDQYKRAHFESHETGWFGLNSEWAQRIYIGESEEDTTRWLSQMQTQYYKQKLDPVEGEWDEGLGNPEFMLVRIQNLGLLCQGKQASLCIEQLNSQIVDVESPCPVPTATKFENLWTIRVSEPDCQIMFQGGQPVYDSDTLQFSELPTTITVYNRYAMSWKYTQSAINSYDLLQEGTDPSN